MLAHQGGWDEILLVVGPIAVVLGLLAARPTGGVTPAADRATADPERDQVS